MNNAQDLLQKLTREYESLTLANDFIFRKVMENEDLCRRLLETILHIEIDHLEYQHVQEDLKLSPNARGVRLDVYVKNSDAVYDIEMQSVAKKNLPKRARYYQAVIDSAVLEAGIDSEYANMPDSYVIFICLTDPFANGLHYYSCENMYVYNGKGVPIGDGSKMIFLNAEGTADDIDPELSAFLKYLKNGAPSNAFTHDLDLAVKRGRINSEWRSEYMKMSLFEYDAIERGKEIGKEIGKKEALEEIQCLNAKRMAAKGLSAEQIADFLEISVEDVDRFIHTEITDDIKPE